VTGPGPVEARVLRGSLLAVVITSMFGLAVTIGAMIFVESESGIEWLSRALGTTLIAFLAGTGGLAATMVMQQGRLVWLMRAVVVLLVVIAVWWGIFFWLVGRRLTDDSFARLAAIGGTLTIPTLTLLFGAQLAVMRTKRQWLSWTRWAVIAELGVFAAATVSLFWTDWWRQHDELVGSLWTLWGMATLAAMSMVTMLVRREARKKPTPAEAVSRQARLEMTCPRCGAEQTLPSGVTRCGRCRQTLRIEVEEPRCECGYLLFRLEGDQCPECGRALVAEGSVAPDTSPGGARDDLEQP